MTAQRVPQANDLDTADHHIWGLPQRIRDPRQTYSSNDSGYGSSSGDSSGRFNMAVSGLMNVEFHDSDSGSDLSGSVSRIPGYPGSAGSLQRASGPWRNNGATSSSFQMAPMAPDEQELADEEKLFGARCDVARRPDKEAVAVANIDRAEVQEENTANVDPATVELHNSGECRPCLYYNSKRGCMNGAECRFCHLAHGKKTRPCKSKRTECKQIADMLHTVFGEESQEFHHAAMKLSAESAYMRTILGKNRPAAVGTGGNVNGADPSGASARAVTEAAAMGVSFPGGALSIMAPQGNQAQAPLAIQGS